MTDFEPDVIVRRPGCGALSRGRAQVEVLPESGHSPQVERPGATAKPLRVHVGTVVPPR